MNDGLVLASTDGDVLYANPGALMLIGANADTLVGQSIEMIHTALRGRSTRPDQYDLLRTLAESGEQPAWVIEYTAGVPYRAIQVRVFDVIGEAGSSIGRGLLLRDVTREQEIDQFKTTLLGAVGHELRTPLAVIKMHASSLLQEDIDWSPADQRQFVADINSEVDRLAALVRNILDLSRLEAGLLQLNRAPWSLATLLDQTVQRLRQRPERLTVELPCDLPPVDVDGPRIEVVLRNLLANAVAYGYGRVVISAEVSAGGVTLRIHDNGLGIAPDEVPHLFEQFYRAARGQEQRVQGVGLGLAICKAFTEAHGGRIWFEPGQGATFAVQLPIWQSGAPVA